MFDVTDTTSFESIIQCHQEVLERVKPFNIFFLVVGHKSDPVAEWQVMLEEGDKLAASSSGAHCVDTSAKSNSNISTYLSCPLKGSMRL